MDTLPGPRPSALLPAALGLPIRVPSAHIWVFPCSAPAAAVAPGRHGACPPAGPPARGLGCSLLFSNSLEGPFRVQAGAVVG